MEYFPLFFKRSFSNFTVLGSGQCVLLIFQYSPVVSFRNDKETPAICRKKRFGSSFILYRAFKLYIFIYHSKRRTAKLTLSKINVFHSRESVYFQRIKKEFRTKRHCFDFVLEYLYLKSLIHRLLTLF